MTLSNLAKLANVSVSTASKAFSGSPEVNELTRDAVFAVARENGCFKKFFNAKYPKFVVALICPELHSRYYAELCFSIQRFLSAKNCEVCISAVGFSPSAAAERIEYYENYSSVDAIVLVDSNYSEKIPQHEIPIVSLGRHKNNTDISVITDTDDAVGKAITQLLSSGAKSIGFIGESLTYTKQKIFESKLRALTGSVDERLIYTSDKRFQEGGFEGAQHFYECGALPDALVCAYDDMAFGAIRFLSDMGISVPEDIFVVGMDNTPNAEHFCPRLSSVGFASNVVAEKVAKSVLTFFSGTTAESDVEKLSASFFARESSKKATDSE